MLVRSPDGCSFSAGPGQSQNPGACSICFPICKAGALTLPSSYAALLRSLTEVEHVWDMNQLPCGMLVCGLQFHLLCQNAGSIHLVFIPFYNKNPKSPLRHVFLLLPFLYKLPMPSIQHFYLVWLHIYFTFVSDNEPEKKAPNKGIPAKSTETNPGKVEYKHLFLYVLRISC